MNFKTTIVLVALLVLLGGFVYLMRDRAPSYEQEQQQRQAAAQGKPLFTADQLKAGDIDTLTITHAGKRAVLKKSGSAWRQVEPAPHPLTSWMVDDLVNEAIALKSTDAFTPGKGDYPPADALGLSPAVATLTLGKAGGDASTDITLEAGRSILGGKAYVRIQGKPDVHVVADTLAKQLSDDPVNRLRQRSFITPTESQSDAVTLASPGQPSIELRKAEGRWHFTAPQADRASREAIASLLTTLGSAPIRKFIEDAPQDLSRYGLDLPRVVFTVVSSKADPSTGVKPVTQTLAIGGATDLANTSYFATWTQDQDKPVVVTVSADLLGKFSKRADDLRDPHLATLKAGDVRHLALQHAGRRLAFSRGASGWTFDDTAIKFQADDGVVSELVAAITSVQAQGYAPAAERNDPPLATIELTALGKADPVILDAWAMDKNEQGQDRWLVVARHETVGRIVAADKLAMATAPDWQWRDRQAGQLPLDRINRVSLRQPGRQPMVFARTLPTPVDAMAPATAPPPETAQDTPGPWTLERAERNQPTMVDQTQMASLLSAVTPLQVASWLPPGQAVDAAYKLEVQTDQGQQLSLSMNEQGQARLEGVDQAFTISPSLQAAIKAEHGDRRLIAVVHQDDLASVTRELAGQTITLSRNPQRAWVVTPEPPAPARADANAPQRLIDALFGAQVLHWLDTPPASLPEKPAVRFTIVHKETGRLAITIYAQPADKPAVGQVNDRWFTLSQEALAKLQMGMEQPATAGR